MVRVAGVRLRRGIDQHRNPRWVEIGLRWSGNRDWNRDREGNREQRERVKERRRRMKRKGQQRERKKGEEDK